MAYTVSTTAGMVTNNTTVQTGASITVNFGETFTLTTANTDTTAVLNIITLSAIDQGISQQATASVTQSSAPAITLTPESLTLPIGGGTFIFTVAGGSFSTYDITTAAGTVCNDPFTPPCTTTTVTIIAGGRFALTTGAALNGITFDVTAIDPITGLVGTSTIQQQAP